MAARARAPRLKGARAKWAIYQLHQMNNVISEINHRYVETNDLRMHIAERGSGPLVVLLHGFPGCWYSWRQQLAALAAADFHAVAPDQRGTARRTAPTMWSATRSFTWLAT